tara:strand:- start:54 stop:659 length:606 start_codon:yes stop_codon:yes gene_type:complete
MIIYRKSKLSDLDEIVDVHLTSFKSFFLTSLGSPFLKVFYRTCLNNNQIVPLSGIDKESNKLIGFVIATKSSNGFYKKLILSNFKSYLYQSIKLFFIKPMSLIRIYRNLTKGKKTKVDSSNYSELLSLAVLPEKKGLGIGKNLLSEIEKKIKNEGINAVTLTTDALNNKDVLSFYKKLGYKVFYDFSAYPRRKMFKLIKYL